MFSVELVERKKGGGDWKAVRQDSLYYSCWTIKILPWSEVRVVWHSLGKLFTTMIKFWISIALVFYLTHFDRPIETQGCSKFCYSQTHIKRYLHILDVLLGKAGSFAFWIFQTLFTCFGSQSWWFSWDPICW